MTTLRTVDVAAIIDREGVSTLQLFIMALCMMVVILDGFDVQTIAFTGAAIAKEWEIAPARLGPLFAAGMVGMLVGAFTIGPLGDRSGRKPTLLASVGMFGLFSLATAFACGYEQLLTLRFLTGLGLGGAVPNLTALVAEYVPRRWRAVMISVILLGVPLGGLLGGVLTAKLLPMFGWRSIFAAGGLLPLAMVPVLALTVPESIRFLVAHGDGSGARICKILARIHPAGGYTGEDRFIHPEPVHKGFPVRHLFTEGRAHDTLLIWAAFFTNSVVVLNLMNWIPSLAVEAGFAMEKGTLALMVLNLGGLVGPLALAHLACKYGSRRVIALGFLASTVAVAAIGQGGAWPAFMIATTFVAGFFTYGNQIAIYALAVNLYPTEVRSTGVGWTLGIGRVGAIVGPMLGGLLLALQWGMPLYFLFFGILLVIAAAAIASIRFDDRPGQNDVS